HIHSGIGQSTGALDLPVSRERTTHYPFIPGSGVKGAFRVWASEERVGLKERSDRLFGPSGQSKIDEGGDAGAGTLLLSDARLLLLPVRSLSEAFKWVTCPAILNRFARDCARAGISCKMTLPSPSERQYYGNGKPGSWLGLEEREAECKGALDPSLLGAISAFVGEQVKDRLIVISDNDFTWYARFALPVMARNALKAETKCSDALWYEESLAPDTIMYILLAQRKAGAVADIVGAIAKDGAQYVQIGGNETIGQGWFRMAHFEGA
ncbi:MAG: type III-B CRISPR module RAMP protein Cmr4, partial [Cohaesibacter sp.]|nr:type III-B CRISPR module RAMP protein Cmr4 [Cohaesibacter sp.]